MALPSSQVEQTIKSSGHKIPWACRLSGSKTFSEAWNYFTEELSLLWSAVMNFFWIMWAMRNLQTDFGNNTWVVTSVWLICGLNGRVKEKGFTVLGCSQSEICLQTVKPCIPMLTASVGFKQLGIYFKSFSGCLFAYKPSDKHSTLQTQMKVPCVQKWAERSPASGLSVSCFSTDTNLLTRGQKKPFTLY